MGGEANHDLVSAACDAIKNIELSGIIKLCFRIPAKPCKLKECTQNYDFEWADGTRWEAGGWDPAAWNMNPDYGIDAHDGPVTNEKHKCTAQCLDRPNDGYV